MALDTVTLRARLVTQVAEAEPGLLEVPPLQQRVVTADRVNSLIYMAQATPTVVEEEAHIDHLQDSVLVDLVAVPLVDILPYPCKAQTVLVVGLAAPLPMFQDHEVETEQS